MSARIPVLFDTDIGSDIDDAVALLYLIAEPKCELLGVSSVSGRPGERAKLADAVCRAAGRTDIPIWSGKGAPLLRDQQQPECPQAEVLSNWEHHHSYTANRAVLNIRKTIRRRPDEIVLVSVGPMSNIGLLFALDPEIPSMVKRLVVMGGSYWSGEKREWNMKCDPHAAACAFGSSVPDVNVYGLDVTKQCTLSADRCRGEFTGGALNIIAEMAEVWFREREEITFHDPLAACSVVRPDLCDYVRGDIEVEYGNPDTMGSTHLRERAEGKHAVAKHVDESVFFEQYFHAVKTLR